MEERPRLVVAGTHSGCGKTTVALAITAAFTQRGHQVQPFKVGPDYLDTGHLGRAAGSPCRNLDSWMLPHDTLQRIFVEATSVAGIAIIEGAMGLHDGRSGEGRTASTAEIVALLQAPVLLVIDAKGVGRSAGAIVAGYSGFDPRVNISGVILNRVGSETHARLLKQEIEALGFTVYGWLPKDDRFSITERHLGLESAAEGVTLPVVRALCEQAEKTFDIGGMKHLSEQSPQLEVSESTNPPTGSAKVRIAYASDEAFHFYYVESLDLLRRYGAELVPFSPLRDRGLPEDVDGIYIGGGYPELHAAELEENRHMRRELGESVESDMPVYAECGGLMYLMEGLVDRKGRESRMVGAFQGRALMSSKRRALGYSLVRATEETLLLPKGTEVRAHEYHYSGLEGVSGHFAYEVRKVPGGQPEPDGLKRNRTLASYVHLNFASDPNIARRFVEVAGK